MVALPKDEVESGAHLHYQGSIGFTDGKVGRIARTIQVERT